MNHSNFLTIQQEMQWLEGRLNEAFDGRLNRLIDYPPAMLSADPPMTQGVNTVYAQFIEQHELSIEDRLLLALAMVPHCQLDLLARFRRTKERHLIAGSLIKSASHDYWLPSGLTYTHLYASLRQKEAAYQGANYLYNQSWLMAQGIVSIGLHLAGEPALSGVLVLDHNYWQVLTENSSNTQLLILNS